MRVVIIGGSGHVGTYLVPRLAEAGHEVVNVSRGKHNPYQASAAWEQVRQVTVDREKEDAKGAFGKRIAELEPDVVIDMICFTQESAEQITEALLGRIQHYLFCGSIWIHGHSVNIPTTEEQPREPFGDYGIRKAACETYLLKEARRNGFPATLIHPGHIVGPGWAPLNPAGHFTPEVFARLAKGESLTLPNLGMETLHHVHADDVAQIFMKAVARRSCALGESFHVVSPQAMTLRGYADSVASWFGRKADLRFLPWEDWRKTVTKDEAAATWDHIAHSPNCSTAKARALLGFEPRYTSPGAVREAVKWLIDNGVITI